MKNTNLYEYIKICGSKLKGGSFRQRDYSSDSIYARRYYLLLLLLINTEITFEALVPFIELIAADSISKSGLQYIANVYRKSFGKAIEAEGISYAECVRVRQRRYKQYGSTLELTDVGISYLLFLNQKLSFLSEEEKADEEDFRRWFKERRVAVKDHSLQNLAVFNECVVNIPGAVPVAEKGRGDDFQVLNEARSGDGLFYSDLSFSLYHDPYVPVMIETDMETEKVGVLCDKVFREISYGYNNARKYMAQPGITIFVIGENAELAPRKREQNNGVTSSEIRLLYNYKTLSHINTLSVAVREILRLRGEEVEAVTVDRVIEVMAGLIKPGSGRGLSEILMALKSYIIANKLYGSDVADVCDDIEETMNSEKEKGTNRRAEYFASRLVSKRSNISERLLQKETCVKYFEGGESVPLLSFSNFRNGLKSILPDKCGRENVRAVLKAVGLNKSYSKYWSCRPLMFDNNRTDYLNLRNCFLSNGVYVFFEDVSYDIASLTRVREYLSIPSTLIRNSLLVMIIDDDEMLADGTYLRNSLIYGYFLNRIRDSKGHDFKDAFVEAYGNEGILGYKYRQTNDFCFVKRSEFEQAAEIHPFVRLGSDVFIERSKDVTADDRLISYMEGGTYRTATRFASDFRRYSF